MEYLPAVSVIVPVYNVEKYIGRCVRSLFEQTLGDIEYIFINDCSPDHSMDILSEILKEYPEREKQMKILNHPVNCGVSNTREEGIYAATGKYVIFCDSDDWVEPDMYRLMYETAEREKGDIVGCDLVDEYPGKSVYRRQQYDLPKDELIRSMLLSDGRVLGYLHERMVRRELYLEHDIHFPESISMWEDLVVTIKLHFFANKTVYLPKGFYHYEHSNPDSLVTNVNLSQLNSMIGAARCIEGFLREEGIWDYYKAELMQLMLMAKMPLITRRTLYDLDHWRKLWPETNEYILKYPSLWMKCSMWLVKHDFGVLNRVLIQIVDFLISI